MGAMAHLFGKAASGPQPRHPGREACEEAALAFIAERREECSRQFKIDPPPYVDAAVA